MEDYWYWKGISIGLIVGYAFGFLFYIAVSLIEHFKTWKNTWGNR